MLSIASILVPTDFSDCSAKALQCAGGFASRYGARIEALHVWEPPRYVIAEVAVQVPGEGRQTLHDFARVEAAKQMEGFMGTHGRTGLAHLLLGSVAEQVIRRAPCPVLTIRQCDRDRSGPWRGVACPGEEVCPWRCSTLRKSNPKVWPIARRSPRS